MTSQKDFSTRTLNHQKHPKTLWTSMYSQTILGGVECCEGHGFLQHGAGKSCGVSTREKGADTMEFWFASSVTCTLLLHHQLKRITLQTSELGEYLLLQERKQQVTECFLGHGLDASCTGQIQVFAKLTINSRSQPHVVHIVIRMLQTS